MYIVRLCYKKLVLKIKISLFEFKNRLGRNEHLKTYKSSIKILLKGFFLYYIVITIYNKKKYRRLLLTIYI